MNHFNSLLVKSNYFAFLVIIINFCLLSSLYSKIIYKEIDTIISAPLLNQSQMYYLDMNDDGIDEYFFNHANQMGTIVCEIYSNPPSFTNEILIENNIPKIINPMSEISELSSEWKNTYNGVGTSALYFLDNWPGAKDKYVGVRFKINNEYHYGWIGIEIPADSTYIKIKDCAYDDLAGQLIYAGYKVIDDVTVNYTGTNLFFNNNKLYFNTDKYVNSMIEIYDIYGNIIENEQIINNYFDFNNFSNGVYFVVIKNNNKIVEKAVILK